MAKNYKLILKKIEQRFLFLNQIKRRCPALSTTRDIHNKLSLIFNFFMSRGAPGK